MVTGSGHTAVSQPFHIPSAGPVTCIQVLRIQSWWGLGLLLSVQGEAFRIWVCLCFFLSHPLLEVEETNVWIRTVIISWASWNHNRSEFLWSPVNFADPSVLKTFSIHYPFRSLLQQYFVQWFSPGCVSFCGVWDIFPAFSSCGFIVHQHSAMSWISWLSLRSCYFGFDWHFTKPLIISMLDSVKAALPVHSEAQFKILLI